MFSSLNAIQHQPGHLLFGQYEIVSMLGVGSCGYVYLAKHKGLSDFLVALKVFYPDTRNSKGESRVDFDRLKSEIRASYGVNHPNVIRCFEYVSQQDLAGFTMEYAARGSLRKMMQNGKVHDLNVIVSVLASICEGLSAIHKSGIIHRDLKPENILFNSSGTLKIADFSISISQEIQEVGSPVGTVDYMCPEYLSNGKLDLRGDIYAVGAIMYQILTGDIPCQGANPYHTLRLRMENEPMPLLYLRPDCPLQLEHIVTKALQREPQNRYQSADEMLNDVNEFKKILANRNSLNKPRIEKSEEQKNSILPEKKVGYFAYLAFFSLFALCLMLLSLVL